MFLPPAKLAKEISENDLKKLDKNYKKMEGTVAETSFGIVGKSRKLYSRHLICSMIRGENIVVIQQA